MLFHLFDLGSEGFPVRFTFDVIENASIYDLAKKMPQKHNYIVCKKLIRCVMLDLWQLCCQLKVSSIACPIWKCSSHFCIEWRSLIQRMQQDCWPKQTDQRHLLTTRQREYLRRLNTSLQKLRSKWLKWASKNNITLSGWSFMSFKSVELV